MLKKIIIYIVIIVGFSCVENKQNTIVDSSESKFKSYTEIENLYFGVSLSYPDFYSTLLFKSDLDKTILFSCNEKGNPNFSCENISTFEIPTSEKIKSLFQIPFQIRNAETKESLLQLNDHSYYILKFKDKANEDKEVYISSDFSNLNQEAKLYMLKISQVINKLETRF